MLLSFCFLSMIVGEWLCVCADVNWLAVSQDDFSLFLLTTFMWKGWYEFVTVCTESLFNDSIPQGPSRKAKKEKEKRGTMTRKI